jgi:hypothetical protein
VHEVCPQDWALIPGASERWSRLKTTLLKCIRSIDTAQVRPYVSQLTESRSEAIAAVLFYGSCMFSGVRTQTSIPDFYVITRSPRRYHRSLTHAALNRVLPPNVYYGVFEGADGQSLRCKYCVMSLDQFERETSCAASDIHHLGRFSKLFAVAHVHDPAIEDLVVERSLCAMLTLVPHSLARLPNTFTLEQFLQTQLGLSYLGEQRVSEPSKVLGLLEAGRAHYERIYPEVLKLYGWRTGTLAASGDNGYRQEPRWIEQRARSEAFLRRSRVRGVLRWPKYILTVDNWVDYILDKLERHQGIKVELTPLQRRYPLIFGWPVYFEMRRRGVVK